MPCATLDSSGCKKNPQRAGRLDAGPPGAPSTTGQQDTLQCLKWYWTSMLKWLNPAPKFVWFYSRQWRLNLHFWYTLHLRVHAYNPSFLEVPCPSNGLAPVFFTVCAFPILGNHTSGKGLNASFDMKWQSKVWQSTKAGPLGSTNRCCPIPLGSLFQVRVAQSCLTPDIHLEPWVCISKLVLCFCLKHANCKTLVIISNLLIKVQHFQIWSLLIFTWEHKLANK